MLAVVIMMMMVMNMMLVGDCWPGVLISEDAKWSLGNFEALGCVDIV